VKGLHDTVELRLGDARALPFVDAEFDVVLAVTTLAHMPEAEKGLLELVRVVRPTGRVGIFDLDGDGVILAHPDRALTRRIVAASADHLLVNGWLGRRLPALLTEAGLTSVGVRAFTPVERDPAGFYAKLAERRAAVAVQAGAITENEERGWLAALRAEQAAGRFLAGQTHLFVWGIRPP
jgi:ubiquinone/menaquinone biosynthesis C-methylase UbiE